MFMVKIGMVKAGIWNWGCALQMSCTGSCFCGLYPILMAGNTSCMHFSYPKESSLF